MGYYRAGFDIVGVDIRPQKNYPFMFVQADALEYAQAHGEEYDAIHASPPCQGYSVLRNAPSRSESAAMYPQLITDVRKLLLRIGKLFVIENVVGAPLINPLMLCGTMFGLRTRRHRLFESNPAIYFPPAPCNHYAKVAGRARAGSMNVFTNDLSGFVTVAGHMFTNNVGSVALGIDWMTNAELAEAIPPAYTEFIGKHLIESLRSNHAHP